MPSLKPSTGHCYIASPCLSFSAWIRAELNNMRDWNPQNLMLTGDTFRWYNDGKRLWSITINRNHIFVKSDEPVIYLRQGLLIRMGDGRIIVQGRIASQCDTPLV